MIGRIMGTSPVPEKQVITFGELSQWCKDCLDKQDEWKLVEAYQMLKKKALFGLCSQCGQATRIIELTKRN